MKKSTCPEEVDFCVKKRPKSEIRQNLIQLNEIGPNPASNDCQRRRSPRASIDCQEKEPQSQQCQEVIPNPAKIDCREPRGYPKHPGALTGGGHPRSDFQQTVPRFCHPDCYWGIGQSCRSIHTLSSLLKTTPMVSGSNYSPRLPLGTAFYICTTTRCMSI